MSNVVHVGRPSPEFEDWDIFTYHLHYFGKLQKTKGKSVNLPSFSCSGCEWKLHIYPGGCNAAKDGWTSLFLEQVSGKKIKLKWRCTVRDERGKMIKDPDSCCYTFEQVEDKRLSGYRHFFPIPMREVPVYSNNTLTFELRVREERAVPDFCFIPKNPFSDNMLKLSDDQETSDVKLEVNGEIICAHLAVLKLCAPALASLCIDCGEGNTVPISGIDTEIFRYLLEYIYGRKVPAVKLEQHAREFIDGANKFGVTNLKIEAEAMNVSKFELTVDNVVETLLYAESKHLALMKEAAMSFITKNAEEVLSSDSFKNIPADQNVLSELLSVLAIKNKACPGGSKAVTYKSMSVSDLRWELAEKKMDIDGSREMLIARLEENSKEESLTGKKRKFSETSPDL